MSLVYSLYNQSVWDRAVDSYTPWSADTIDINSVCIFTVQYSAYFLSTYTVIYSGIQQLCTNKAFYVNKIKKLFKWGVTKVCVFKTASIASDQW